MEAGHIRSVCLALPLQPPQLLLQRRNIAGTTGVKGLMQFVQLRTAERLGRLVRVTSACIHLSRIVHRGQLSAARREDQLDLTKPTTDEARMYRYRRRLLHWLAAGAVWTALALPVQADMVDRELLGEPEHKVVYQFNKADPSYMDSVLFSVGELLRKHSDNIHIVVTAIGPGIHILAKKPLRPVSDEVRERVASLAMYGVTFHACGNTMSALNWTKSDLLDFAEVVDIGADDIMRLQEEGYSYISW